MNFILYSPKSNVAFNIFSYPIKWYGIFMCCAIFTGIFLVKYFLSKKNMNDEFENFLDFTPYLVIISILGARIFYCIGSFDYYLNFPKEILYINHGGLSIFGAIFFGIIVTVVYLKFDLKKITLYLDAIAFSMPVCQSIGRIGNFFNQEAYGMPYNGFLKLYINDSHRYNLYRNIQFYHPTFLYEIILNLLLFILFFMLLRLNKNIKSGMIFSWYLISYGVIRLLIESLRIDSVLDFAFVHVAQLISLFSILVGLIIYFYIKNHE